MFPLLFFLGGCSLLRLMRDDEWQVLLSCTRKGKRPQDCVRGKRGKAHSQHEQDVIQFNRLGISLSKPLKVYNTVGESNTASGPQSVQACVRGVCVWGGGFFFENGLDLGHGSNVGGLNVVLDLVGDPLLELVQRDLLVLDDEGHLELADTVADGDERGGTPNETVDLDGTDTLLEGLHVGLVIPRLDVKGNERLGSGAGALGSLLLVVLGNTLSLDALSLLVDLVVRAEEVNVVVIVVTASSGTGEEGAKELGSLGLVASERLVLSLVGGDVLEPAGNVSVLVSVGGRADGLVDGNVSLRGGVAGETKEMRGLAYMTYTIEVCLDRQSAVPVLLLDCLATGKRQR